MPDILLILLIIGCGALALIGFLWFLESGDKEPIFVMLLSAILIIGSAMWLSIAPVYSETIVSPIYIDNGAAYVNTTGNPMNLNILFGRNNIDPKISHVEVIQHKGFAGGIYWVCQSAQWRLVTTVPDTVPSTVGPVENNK